MDNRTEAREFLVSRRAKITPEQANLPAGTNRRVPGLRRSEVAALAGVSAGVLHAVTDGPAFVRNGRMDLLAANRLARVFYADPQRHRRQDLPPPDRRGPDPGL